MESFFSEITHTVQQSAGTFYCISFHFISNLKLFPLSFQWEAKEVKGQEEFEIISKTLRREISRFEVSEGTLISSNEKFRFIYQ